MIYPAPLEFGIGTTPRLLMGIMIAYSKVVARRWKRDSGIQGATVATKNVPTEVFATSI